MRFGLRLLIWSYFPLFSVGLALSLVRGSDVFQGLVFVPAGAYVGFRIFRFAALKKRVFPSQFDIGVALLFSYIICYSALYFPRAYSGPVVIGTAPTMIVHTLFWHLAFSSGTYRGSPGKFFRDVGLSISFGFLFGLFNALAFTGFDIQPGMVHDLTQRSPFVRSDLDVPLMALAPIAFTLAAYWPSGRALRLRQFLRNTQFAGIAIMGVFALWYYSRRGPIFAFILILALAVLPLKRKRWILFVPLVATPLLPLAWDLVSPWLLSLSETGIMSGLIARNRPEDYLSATGRLYSWRVGFDFLSSFQMSHLVGYGGAPEHMVLEGHVHMHSMVLDLFFDAGLVTMGLAFGLITLTFQRLVSMMGPKDPYSVEAKGLFLFLAAWILISAVEPTLRSFTVPHMLFLVVVASTMNIYRNCQGQEGTDVRGKLTSGREDLVRHSSISG